MTRSNAAREAILKEAARLFARKGYAAVGVREIAGNAAINISMISYYFKGKSGVLREIVDTFFQRYARAVTKGFDTPDDLPLEQRISALIRHIVQCLRENEHMFKVAFFQLPYDLPEINDIRTDNIKRIRALFKRHFFKMAGIGQEIYPHLPVIGPAVMAMIFSHFTLGPALADIFDDTHDDAFFDSYADTVTRIILGGLPHAVAGVDKS